MTDALDLARAVIAKYGADADKPSARLARALLSLHAECERMRAVAEAARAWHSEQIFSLRTPLTDAIEALDATKEKP